MVSPSVLNGDWVMRYLLERSRHCLSPCSLREIPCLPTAPISPGSVTRADTARSLETAAWATSPSAVATASTIASGSSTERACKARFSEREGTALCCSGPTPKRAFFLLPHLAKGNGTHQAGVHRDTVT